MLRLSKTQILVSSSSTDGLGQGPVRPASAKGRISLAQPGHPMDFGWAETLTWVLGVESVVGEPSAWSLGVRFQYCLDNMDGFQYTKNRWYDLAEENFVSDIAEGVPWHGPNLPAPVVANEASILPVTVKRTIRNHPRRVRVLLDPQFTGGSNPGLYINLQVTPRT
ncbi:alanine racemase [Mycolicibacterium canariasense]|uniref:Alanine racemase n=1 Tax=Mycolicibacterium canariasense TaxID=228230 RepID=A0A100WK77_MYCCR|nr:hypothetical protein [Mycolicibacterium canariasense]MCV7207520.1 hypothetical protein [Mycolicibacterium canariasense]ORV08759.1 hypothetical protein AWB94_11135 [Mycolicibacterium canariasense]GAS99631.1 alanine racemase [Mycolicibacterium canariasense]